MGKKTGSNASNGATVGYEVQIWQMADVLRNNMDAAEYIFTSPPVPLNRKKKYGNLQGEEYVEWLAAFAPRLTEYLTADGSIVIDVGNGWDAGQPTVSTLAIEALLAFKKKAGLHLCQEFICFNPARLPSPAQWVTIERCRVKDAFTRVWWMSPTPRPKADNSRVITEYSGAMRKLLDRATYNPGTRPSEHQIGETSFPANHRGLSHLMCGRYWGNAGLKVAAYSGQDRAAVPVGPHSNLVQ